MTSERLRTLIADDEPLAIERLQILCARVGRINLVGTAIDGAGALRQIQTLKPDLVLLDIQMPGIDGLALAQSLGDQAWRPAIIFVTAYDNFAVSAFNVAAVDYLLKPVDVARFNRAIARVEALRKNTVAVKASPWTREFWVPDRDTVTRIDVRDIDLIEAERDYMRLHVGARSFLLHETISGLERQLDPLEFVRLHRSTLVRRDRVAGFRRTGAGAWEAQLQDGRRLRVGRTYLTNARAMAERPGSVT